MVRQVWRKSQISDYRVNEGINAQKVRLIGDEGDQIGIVSRSEALKAAQDRDLDLVEVAPDADPPVCRLLDYGKFKYRQKKKHRQKRHKSQLKEIRIGLRTEEHDLNFKADQVREFLENGDAVTLSLRLRGREKAHRQQAEEKLNEFMGRFQDVAKIEREPSWVSNSYITSLLVHKS